MTITITHKGTTVTIEGEDLHAVYIKEVISETIDKINAKRNNCTLDKSDGYGMETN